MTTGSTPWASALVLWLLAPYGAGFTVALLPALATPLLVSSTLATVLLGAWTLRSGSTITLQLVGEHGVSLCLDPLAGWFLVLAGLVCFAVWIEARRQGWDRTGWLLLLVLLGALNTCFLTTDLISLYVSLEVVAISAFLLLLKGATTQASWIGLRYLLVSNTAMGLYLIGTALVYAQSGSFGFAALAGLPPGAPLAFVLVGLLTKSGVFLNGLWLPRTHAEAPPEVSALLSGVVVGAGALPLLRLEGVSPAIQQLLVPMALAGSALGVIYALVVEDGKLLLAWSTLAQMGLVVLTPAAGGPMALSHGLAKAALFLSSRHWPNRSLQGWRQRPQAWGLQLPLWLGSLSIAGLPPLLGFSAKKQLQAALDPGPAGLLMVLSIGSVAIFARLWGAPCRTNIGAPLCFGALLLSLPLLLVTPFFRAPDSWRSDGLRALAVLVAGLLLHLVLEQLGRGDRLSLPPLDRLPDLLGGLGLVGAGLLVMMAGGVRHVMPAAGG